MARREDVVHGKLGSYRRQAPPCVAAAPLTAFPQSSIPDPSSTPGALNPAVTQATISATICRSGYAAAIRPPQEETSALKRRQLRLAGMPEGSQDACEGDHLMPLELGGAPPDERSLWPQPRQPADGWDASRKDELEGVLRREVCTGRLPLAQAQREIIADWRAEWRSQVANRPRREANVGSPESLHGDGYYTLVDASVVHSPTVDQGDLGRVTVICADGSHSFSHHCQGTCSRHGGVSAWR